MTRYVALLRGINVGGRNLIPMADLRACFEAEGFGRVSTYIQSGNVLFETDAPAKSLEARIEVSLESRFGAPLMVVVRSDRELATVATKAPDGFGTEPDQYRYDVIFLKSPLTAAKAMKVVALREGVDRAWPGNGVVYFARLSSQRTKSKMSKIVGTTEYQSMTIRNWNTTTKLLALLDGD